jgi:hypothetical protein
LFKDTSVKNYIALTARDNVISNLDIDKSSIDPCNHDEADSRLLLYNKQANDSGHQKVMISTVDSDELIISLFCFHTKSLDELWVDFGVGRHERYISVHEIAALVGPGKCAVLPFWHAFSGCDTVSSFSGRGQKTVMEAWNRFDIVTPVFVPHSNAPEKLSQDQLSVLGKFIAYLCDKSGAMQTVNDYRKYLLTGKKTGRLRTFHQLRQHY